jgi:hypothetical protein
MEQRTTILTSSHRFRATQGFSETPAPNPRRQRIEKENDIGEGMGKRKENDASKA